MRTNDQIPVFTGKWSPPKLWKVIWAGFQDTGSNKKSIRQTERGGRENVIDWDEDLGYLAVLNLSLPPVHQTLCPPPLTTCLLSFLSASLYIFLQPGCFSLCLPFSSFLSPFATPNFHPTPNSQANYHFLFCLCKMVSPTSYLSYGALQCQSSVLSGDNRGFWIFLNKNKSKFHTQRGKEYLFQIARRASISFQNTFLF